MNFPSYEYRNMSGRRGQSLCLLEAKQKYRGVFETNKSENKFRRDRYQH